MEEKPPMSGDEPKGSPEPVWTYRGYQLKASEFNTAMVHFHRAEVQRANVWRQRLDTTTNWAVITAGAAISIAFSQSGTHAVFLVDLMLITIFLIIEARRYRYYEIWAYRVRLMETDFFASMLVPPFHPAPDWAEALADNLLTPRFPISYSEAIGRRLRRNYLYIYAVIGISWIAKITLAPTTAASLTELQGRTAVGPIPGSYVLLVFALFFAGLFLFAFATAGMQQSAGEVLPRYTPPSLFRRGGKPWFRPSHHRDQLLTFIVTLVPEQVSQRLMKDMNRGATILSGTGAYSHQERGILMCALSATEVPHLRAVVAAEDPDAFVIVSPAQGVYGRGFNPLKAEA
jgi:uncharacterized membrane protein